MSLTTLAGVIAGLRPPIVIQKIGNGSLAAGRHGTHWYAGSSPAAASVNASGVNGVALTYPVTGSLPWSPPGSGDTVVARSQLRFNSLTSQGAGSSLLIDRLWHNSGLTNATGAQAITSAAFPARDVNKSTNGEGVLLALEVTTAATVGVPTISVTYTNSAGTGSRTATNIAATSATSAASSVYILSLQTGDTGVRSVQSFSLSVGWTSAVMVLIAFRPIAMFISLGPSQTASAAYTQSRTEDVVGLGAPRVFDGSVLQMLNLMASTVSANTSGQITLASG